MRDVLASSPAKAFFLLCAVAMVWFVPYLVPVTPTISLSYVVGYSNRAALLIFVAAALLFAWLTRGVLARVVSEQDQPMRVSDLALGLVVIMGACFARHPHAQPPKTESLYALNRLQMLMAGVRPYTGFEFVYGPLHLYLPLLAARVLHTSIVNGYYVWWFAQWALGVGMLWLMVRMLPGALSRRRLIFASILLVELPNILAEGTAYTPVRMAGAAFCVLAVSVVWQRTKRPGLLLALAVVATLFELGISPEQGLAVGCGLIAWLVLKAVRERSAAMAGVAGGLAVAMGLMVIWFKQMGVFAGLAEFAGGAYSFPLLPSVPVALLLFAYVAGACAGVRAWLANDFDGPALPLALCGFAALPAAFGRTDLGHMQLGSAALFLGIASIEARPALRRVWSPLLLLFLVGWPVFQAVELGVAKIRHKVPPPGASPYNLMGAPGGGGSGAGLVLHAPCPVVYGAPTLWPLYTETAAQECLETGFFAGMLDVLTPQTIERKAQEIAGARKPLLLQALPLREQLVPLITEVDTAPMRGLQDAFYLPPVRNKSLDYEPVIRAIEDNYTPGPVVAGGLRVWTPKATQ